MALPLLLNRQQTIVTRFEMGCASSSRVLDSLATPDGHGSSHTLTPGPLGCRPRPTDPTSTAHGSPSPLPPRAFTESVLALVIEAAPHGVVVVDAQSTLLLVNSQVETMFRAPRERLLGLNVDSLIPPRLRKNHPAYKAGYLSQPQLRPMGEGREVFALRADGTEVEVEVGLSPLNTLDGPLVVCTIVDISVRREQEQLKRAKAAAEEVARSRSALLSTLSHEIRTPLTGIIGCLELLQAEQQQHKAAAVTAMGPPVAAVAASTTPMDDMGRVQQHSQGALAAAAARLLKSSGGETPSVLAAASLDSSGIVGGVRLPPTPSPVPTPPVLVNREAYVFPPVGGCCCGGVDDYASGGGLTLFGPPRRSTSSSSSISSGELAGDRPASAGVSNTCIHQQLEFAEFAAQRMELIATCVACADTLEGIVNDVLTFGR